MDTSSNFGLSAELQIFLAIICSVIGAIASAITTIIASKINQNSAQVPTKNDLASQATNQISYHYLPRLRTIKSFFIILRNSILIYSVTLWLSFLMGLGFGIATSSQYVGQDYYQVLSINSQIMILMIGFAIMYGWYPIAFVFTSILYQGNRWKHNFFIAIFLLIFDILVYSVTYESIGEAANLSISLNDRFVGFIALLVIMIFSTFISYLFRRPKRILISVPIAQLSLLAEKKLTAPATELSLLNPNDLVALATQSSLSNLENLSTPITQHSSPKLEQVPEPIAEKVVLIPEN